MQALQAANVASGSARPHCSHRHPHRPCTPGLQADGGGRPAARHLRRAVQGPQLPGQSGSGSAQLRAGRAGHQGAHGHLLRCAWLLAMPGGAAYWVAAQHAGSQGARFAVQILRLPPSLGDACHRQRLPTPTVGVFALPGFRCEPTPAHHPPACLQHGVPIFSLPNEWLWCETWCGNETRLQVGQRVWQLVQHACRHSPVCAQPPPPARCAPPTAAGAKSGLATADAARVQRFQPSCLGACRCARDAGQSKAKANPHPADATSGWHTWVPAAWPTLLAAVPAVPAGEDH